MTIRCMYCGDAHPTVDEVRACWQRSQPDQVRVTDPVGDVVARAGPEALGRGLVINAGTPVAPDWKDSERLTIDTSVLDHPDDAISQLVRAASQGQRMVLELRVPFAERPRYSTNEPPYRVGPRFHFGVDVLHHLVWNNSIDSTGSAPRWSLLDRAVALGAAPATDGLSDVVLPNGTRGWLDGGPPRRRAPIDGVGVLHWISVEHGSLALPLEDDDGTIELADDQRAAVSHAGGAARIIAPAGSGKTRVLTERARHLLRTWRVPPSAVSLVAFNKRAQEEMRQRTADLPALNVRTLNSIALAIVNGTPPFRAQPHARRSIEEGDVRRIIGNLVSFPRKRNQDPVATWIEALSVVRLGLRTPREVEAMYEGDVAGLTDVFPKYREVLLRENVLDFDEQIYRAVELLLGDADARDAAQKACRMMLVDEFQDLTPAHVLLIRLLSAPSFAVFGVGDDDQTIYGYNGADPAWLIEFSSLFPNAGNHPLETNYRCPADVVDAADHLLRHNRLRVAKVIRSSRAGTSGLTVKTSDDTLGATIDVVADAIQKGRAADEIAVLTRVNALLVPVHVGLTAKGIPVDSGIGQEFLERVAVRSALAWLRLATATDGSFAATDLSEALRRPSRSIHPNVANWVSEQQSVEALRRLAGRINTERDAARVTAFADDIARLRKQAVTATTGEILSSLTDEVGLSEAVSTLDDTRRGMNRSAQNDDLVAMAQLARLQPDPGSFGSWLSKALVAKRESGGVVLATVHRVKGQEWPVIVLHHAEADQFPHRLAEDVEEERRVFHVAITRCSASIIVVAGSNPSPFIAQMFNEPAAHMDPPARAVSSRPSPQTKTKPAARFGSAQVLAAVGVVLVDGGHNWVIETIEADGVLTRVGKATRRFQFGDKVVTAGRQRGALRSPAPDAPSATSIRTFDLLRQLREQLRNGKPAYVVFDDATLEGIALALPSSLAELRRVKGVGPAKLDQYGDAVLLTIEDAMDST